MNTASPQLTARHSSTLGPIAPLPRGSAQPHRATWGEFFDERAPIISVPAFYGPPIIFVLGPWLLLVLLLIGPVVLVFTVLLVLAIAAGLLAVFVAVIASPYVLIRHLHAHRMVHARPRAPVHPFRTRRVGADRLGSLQPKGVL
jgi:hypothetical protein